MKYARLLFTFFCLFTASYQAQAQVKVTAFTQEQKQGLTEVLLRFDIDRNWHIFAAYEQEFGSPLRVNWTPDSDIKPLEESYSIPQTYHLDDFSYDGYSGIAYYKTTLQLASPSVAPIADISWQACANDECIPQTTQINLDQSNSSQYKRELNSAEPHFVTNNTSSPYNLLIILLSAFLGGILLNLMPCVLPVLSLKAIALFKTPQHQRLQEAFFYSLGVVASMLALATVLWLLRRANPHLGWGFQMQSPIFTGFMLIVFIILTLVLFDIVHISASWLNFLNKLHFNTPKSEAFASGLLAVLIASPCTAPFMGAAISYALFAKPQTMFLVFLALGLGYALPFAALAIIPHTTSRILPHSGNWFKIFKTIMGLPLIFTIFWLAWVFFTQIGVIITNRHLIWEKFSPAALEQTLQQHQPAFIDFTADWCITCLVNHKTSLTSSTMNELTQKLNLKLYKADITNMDPATSQALHKYQRASVPLYIYYDGKSKDYIILPQILTPQILREYLR